ncbi:hypothetical protein DYB38_004871 [Aphanomyces astaci]|uniref:Uncharacterized protein n=1 Tax=Aphanomyces astaci TaxID=112090 RepID=A0A397CBT9_APHAT|nr:hypothetical protein DYB38_004871 [Aphanomyces astaci]
MSSTPVAIDVDRCMDQADASSSRKKLLDAKLSTVYASTRMDRPMKRRIADFTTSFAVHIHLNPHPSPSFLDPPHVTIGLDVKEQIRLSHSLPLPTTIDASPPSADAATATSTMSPSEEWQTALHQFVHPASPAMPQDAAVDDDWTAHRLRTWQDAFRHLYYTFHHKYEFFPRSALRIHRVFVGSPHHDAFYVATAQSVVCFYRATAASTTMSMRSLFTKFLPHDDATSRATTSPTNPTSVRQRLLAASTDVPLLCARFPFQHAGIVPLQVTPCGKMSGRPTPTYKLEVSGCILPRTVHDLANAVRAAAATESDASFHVVLEPWASSTRLNVCGWDMEVPSSSFQDADRLDAIKRHMHDIRYHHTTGYQVGIEK